MQKENMKTKEIPREQWTQFFASFSRQHEGWLITLEIFGEEIGCQVEENELTFQGITDEWDEVSGSTITVMTGHKPEDHVTHGIALPTEVCLEQTDEGADVALAIKSDDGMTALLRFRSPMRSYWVDGVVRSATHVPL